MTYDWQESPATPDRPCRAWAKYDDGDDGPCVERWWAHGVWWNRDSFQMPPPKVWAVIPQPAPPRKVVEDPHAVQRMALERSAAQERSLLEHFERRLAALPPVPAPRWASGEDET